MELTLAVLVAIMLNYYWASLMLKGLLRILQRRSDKDFDCQQQPTNEDSQLDSSNRAPKKVEMREMLDPELPKSNDLQ